MLLLFRLLDQSAQAKSDADALSMVDAASIILVGSVDEPVSLQEAALTIALLTPAESMSLTDAAILLAVAGEDEPITVADAATLVSVYAPDEPVTVSDAAAKVAVTGVGESLSLTDAIAALNVLIDEAMSLSDAPVSPVVIGQPDEPVAVADQPSLVGVGTPDEPVTASDAVVDILAFQSVGPFDEVLGMVDAVLAILEIKAPAIPANIPGGGMPGLDFNQRIAKPLPPLKVKKLPLDYEPAPLPEAIGSVYQGNRELKRMGEITRLMFLHQLGFISDDELEALSAAA